MLFYILYLFRSASNIWNRKDCFDDFIAWKNICEFLAINKKSCVFAFCILLSENKICFLFIDEIFPLHKNIVRMIIFLTCQIQKLVSINICNLLIYFSDNILPASDSAHKFTIVKIVSNCFFFYLCRYDIASFISHTYKILLTQWVIIKFVVLPFLYKLINSWCFKCMSTMLTVILILFMSIQLLTIMYFFLFKQNNTILT